MADTPRPRPAAGLRAGEVVYHRSPGALVTSKWMVLDGDTYPLANVTRVRVVCADRTVLDRTATRRLRRRFAGAFGGAVAALAAAVGWLADDWAAAAAVATLFAVAGRGVVLATTVRAERREYGLVLTTAGGDVEAVWFRDAAAIAELAEAVSDALVG